MAQTENKFIDILKLLINQIDIFFRYRHRIKLINDCESFDSTWYYNLMKLQNDHDIDMKIRVRYNFIFQYSDDYFHIGFRVKDESIFLCFRDETNIVKFKLVTE